VIDPETRVMDFETAMARCPLVAILRGLTPGEALPVGEPLVAAGFTLIVVPLNSPKPLRSISTLVETIGDRAIVGAGTVSQLSQLDAVASTGARLVVSPHTDPALISRAKALDLVTVPGFMTPSEAFTALSAGADALKLFPAQASSPTALAAMLTILPPGTQVLPVGGITPDQMGHWWAAGARGFGLGGTLYRPGRSAREVGRRARACLSAVRGPLETA